MFCCYLYPKTHKSSKELYHHLPKTILRGAAVDGVHLSLLEWTPSHREISLSQSQSRILFLSNLSFSLSLNLGFSILSSLSQSRFLSLNLDFSLSSISRQTATDPNLSFSPNFLNLGLLIMFLFCVLILSKGNDVVPLIFFFFNTYFIFVLITKFIIKKKEPKQRHFGSLNGYN